MFYFCILITVITYPLVFVGSTLLGIVICILIDGSPGTPNPYVSPAKVYSTYRRSFEQWAIGLKAWYIKENGIKPEVTHYHPITGMRYRLRADGRWEFKEVGLRHISYPKNHKFGWVISAMTKGFIPIEFTE